MTERQPPTTQGLIEDLLRPQREQELDPFVVITFMPIEPYDHVADIGCGPGYFAIPLAKHLIYGKLYALDIMDEMLDVLRRGVAEARLGNVEIFKCGSTNFQVPEQSLDGVFLAFVISETQDRVAFLKAVRELLKPRGWCTILEWYKKDTDSGPPVEKRLDPDEAAELCRQAGFNFRRWRDINGREYMATLRK